MIPDGDAQIMIDNHDNQRGHGLFLMKQDEIFCYVIIFFWFHLGAGGDILTFFDARLYKMATAYMLAWPYGKKVEIFTIYLIELWYSKRFSCDHVKLQFQS